MIHNPEWILLSRVRTHNHQMTEAAKAMAVAPRRDDGLGAALVEPFAQRLAVVSLVGDGFGGWWQCSDAGLGDLAVVDVSRRQQEDMRAAPGVADGMDLGVPTAFGAADTMGQAPLFRRLHSGAP